MWTTILLVVLACFCDRAISHDDVGPWYIATKGELFPRAFPRWIGEEFLIVRPSIFQFHVVGNSCDIIEDAIDRYKSIIMADARIGLKAALTVPETFVRQSLDMVGDLIALDIELKNPCEQFPYLQMNENYTLWIGPKAKRGTLIADEVWGILRGLESFSQLIAASSDGNLIIKGQVMEDSPRFPHRGLLLDTSRHYLPVSDILITLDAMSYNKLNVLHWHIIDDNSFPYVSKAYPELSAKGAYHKSMVYTPSNIRKIIEYARLRGIRVIPEFDTPAHSKSWGSSHPEILTQCYEDGKLNGKLGPMNPIKSELWTILETLFSEVSEVFPDRYVHLGGDEISFDCWASNPEIIDYMQKRGYKKDDFKALESEYFDKLLPILKKANLSSIVWQEVFDNMARLPKETVVQIWTEPWQDRMIEVVEKNHSAILSACWYLSDAKAGANWIQYYQCDPTNFSGSPEMKSRVIGGEACVWGEFVDTTNVHQRTWPGACAVAERLWSIEEQQDTDEVARRLEEHICRMNRRGVPAQPPNGAGFCVL